MPTSAGSFSIEDCHFDTGDDCIAIKSGGDDDGRKTAMLIARLVGEILERTGSYVPIFIIAGSAYLVPLLIIHLLAPRFEPAKVE